MDNWSKNGNEGDMAVYWSNANRNQIVIMDNKKFYDIYPELNKHNDKVLKFELSYRKDTSATTKKEIIGYFDTYSEAFEVAKNHLI